MTPRQHALLAFVASYIDAHGFSPCFKEMAVGVGLKETSKGAIHARLGRLIDQGFLTGTVGQTRTAGVTRKGRAALATTIDLTGVDTVVLAAELCRRGHGVELRPAPAVQP